MVEDEPLPDEQTPDQIEQRRRNRIALENEGALARLQAAATMEMAER
jgi:hypothetical protein